MDDSTRDLFIRGMMAAKAKETADAHRYLEWVLRLDPPLDTRVDALYWLSRVAETPDEQRRLLEEALAYNPSEMRCRRALAVLRGELNPSEIIDPDRLTPQAPDPAPGSPGEKRATHAPTGPLAQRYHSERGEASVDRFTCPQCGGRMTYAPDGQSLTCEYCEARQSAKTSAAADDPAAAENFLIAMATRKGHLHPVARQTFNCQGCGIDFLLPPQQLSVTCPYCGSAYVVRSPQSRELIDPHLILPFTVAEKEAERAFKAWLEEQKLLNAASPVRAPAGTPRAQVERVAAIYLPAWSFEMAGQVPWSCQVEERRDHWVTETGSEIVYHASVLVPATPRLSPECAAALRAFDLKEAVPFNERYLADWLAETYQISVGDASLEARRWTYEYEKECVRQRMLRRVRDLSFNSLGITIESFQLALLPVWLAHYRLGDKRYEVVVNGCPSGHARGGSVAVRGQRPQNWLDKLFKR
jgi:predicted RNA-binding Zn-ribbon protein involved in translation (DUF1610 family)